MISIGFSTSNHLLSKAIRKLTASRVSHAFLIFDDTALGGRLIAEASLGGFRLVTAEHFARDNVIVQEIAPQIPLERGLHDAYDWLGVKRYNYLGLLGNLLVLLGRRLRRSWHNPFHGHKSLFCSEAIVRILQESKYPGSDQLIPWDTTPQDLLEFLKRP